MLTGQMGDVMKESAQAALTYVRDKAINLGISQDQLDRGQFHIHVPAGAIPKDGPSAGITMVISLISLLKNQRINKNIAMTGEITLRGKILPIGGVKEKILAARRSGIRHVILPIKNETDLSELNQKVKNDVIIHLVDNIDEVVKIIFPNHYK